VCTALVGHESEVKLNEGSFRTALIARGKVSPVGGARVKRQCLGPTSCRLPSFPRPGRGAADALTSLHRWC
jgi:hypothetical protein